jgi:hypothetical protein
MQTKMKAFLAEELQKLQEQKLLSKALKAQKSLLKARSV